MRISFDLDDTLICYASDVPREPRLPWYKRLIAGDEPLRQGTRKLIADLQARGWEVWIYTTSRRPVHAVRRWFWCHGIQLAGMINQSIHESTFDRAPHQRYPSKNPGAFGIALHVDDSAGVYLEGIEFGFQVVVIDPRDVDWARKVLDAAENL